MDNIVIIGGSGHAKVVVDIVEKESKYKIAGLIDKSRPVGETILGYKVMGRDEDLPELLRTHAIVGGIVCIGDNFARKEVARRTAGLCPEFRFVRAVHPSANMGRDVFVGEGTVVMAGATINPCCRIGRFCIVNTHSSLDHDSEMGDFASLAPKVSTGGNVRIGAWSAVSIGASVVHGVTIGEHSVVGAGATVLEDIGSYKVAYGTPAKTVKERHAGDSYL